MIPNRYLNSKYEDVPVPVRKLFEKMKETRRGIYIHGPVGTGKTHLAFALKQHWDDDPKHTKGSLFWNTTELFRSIRGDFDRKYDKNRDDEKILNSETLLFLDDVGSEKVTDFVAETFYLILNHRYQDMLPVIFTSNLSISELAERIGDRAVSRIVEMCDVVELVGEDRRLENTQKIKVEIKP